MHYKKQQSKNIDVYPFAKAVDIQIVFLKIIIFKLNRYFF